MRTAPMMPTLTIAAVVGLALACDTEENSVPRGDSIPNTDIASCGDDLIDHAPPTGTFNNGSLIVSETGTTFDVLQQVGSESSQAMA